MMGLSVNLPQRGGHVKLYTLKDRVIVNAEGDALHDPKKHQHGKLLGVKGDQIPLEQAVELGLAKEDEGEEEPAKKAGAKGEDKAGKKGASK
jgi:hypothetical protein